MPARRARSSEARIAFDSIAIEGALLSPDWLTRLAQLSAGEQAESDYRIPKGLNLRDEIGRYWRIAQALWRDFDAGLSHNADPEALSRSFVPSLLREVFGFASLTAVEAVEREGRRFPLGHAALGLKVPVVIAPANSGLDTLTPRFSEDGKRRSAFGLVQEFLNATDEALWGLACNGNTLRVLRDNASLTRPAWIEADLARIFREERYADFAALWLLVHESRFGTTDGAPPDCPLERWRAAGRIEGTRAREHLRRGVELALVDLGQGFLSHPENITLRTALDDGSLSLDAYFQQLLRLCYRLIFLLTAEERDVLHPPSTDARTRDRYGEGYSLRRLRERSTRRSNHDRFGDHWEGLRIVLRAMAKGEPRLGLPALGGLFSTSQCADLDASKLENRALLAAVFHLSWLRETTGLSRVNWRDMGPEELGSVYESLLELVPQRAQQGRVFEFKASDASRANARRPTGSYYTPDSLVQVLLDNALDPVMRDAIAAHPGAPIEALLSLSIVDPTCGSGHFLLAAARRLAAQVARLDANGTPSAAQYRHALRQVVSRCIYGVDLNPMALELCRVSLWMEAVEPGLPLSFLDSHLQHGNALLGATPELLAKGVPDEAWEPIEGDEKQVARALKRRNKLGAKGQGSLVGLWSTTTENQGAELTRAVEALDRSADDALEAIDAKSRTWDEIRASAAFRQQKFVADAWCAAFVWPKVAGETAEAAPTDDLWQTIRSGHRGVPEVTRKTALSLASKYHFLHWHLAFPQVFKRGGFDVVLGNPPFLNAIESDVRSSCPHLLKHLSPDAEGTADVAFRVLALAARIRREGGRVGMIQPRALLNASSMTRWRQKIGLNGLALVFPPTRSDLFSGAQVFITLIVLGNATKCVVGHGSAPDDVRWSSTQVTSENWWSLTDESTSNVVITGTPLSTLFAVAASMTTGDAYEIAPFVVSQEAGTELKLITTGLIDPQKILWGESTCRYLKKDYQHPRIVGPLTVARALIRRLDEARRPKLLIGGLSASVEVALDERGECVGAVSTYTIYHPENRTDALTALMHQLLSDETTRRFKRDLGGNAMGGGNITMKKSWLESFSVA